MARQRKKKELPAVELNLTAMVDVAFQLLIFFIVSAAPVDVLTQLNASASGSSTDETGEPPPPPSAQIQITADGVSINDTPVSPDGLEDRLAGVSRLSKNEMVLIKTSLGSRHDTLVTVLDYCNKASLTNLSIMSIE